MLLFADALLNPGQDALADAAVWVQGDKVRFAGPRAKLPEDARSDPEKITLPKLALMPGFVNAHAHLELSAFKDLPYPGSFTAWVRALLAAKNLRRDPNESGFEEGIHQSLESGVTTVADHVSVTENLEPLLNSPLRGFAFVEVLGVVPEIAQDIYQAARLLRESCAEGNFRIRVVPSPHSVHALHPEILETLLHDSADLVSVHLGESEDEHRYFRDKSGPMHELIAERGSALKREAASSFRELDRLGLLTDRILAVHGNYLDPEEIQILRERKLSIVHCPLSHRYFSHRPFPLEDIRRAGINVALGTDSLASAASLSMFDVIRTFETRHRGVKRAEIFRMATENGAKALRMDGEIGSIAAGKKADIVGVPLPRGTDPLDAIFQAEKVSLSIIDGEIIFLP